MKNSCKLFSFCLFAAFVLAMQGCGPEAEITGMVREDQSDAPVPGAAVLGMVWIEDADKTKPALKTDGLNIEDRNAAYEKDATERGLPVAYTRTFTDEKGWFTLDKLHFSGATKKAVKAMKQPRITRITLCAFQRGYLKGALTAFPKDEKELPGAVIVLSKPKNWKELSLDSSFSSLERPEYYNGYSKEFGATKQEKNWFFEYTHSNLYKAYTESDIKGNKDWEKYCGHDYSDIIISTAGMYRNPAHERCGELLKRISAVRNSEEFWENHALAPEDWVETAKRLAQDAIAGLNAENSELKAYEQEILAGITTGNQNLQGTVAIDWVELSKTRLEEAKLLYGKGDKAAAYKMLGQAIHARMRTVPADVQISQILTATKDAVAGFYQLMNRPQTAQLPNSDNGNGKDTPLAKLDRELKQAKSTDTIITLINKLETTIPETDGDVATLGRLMDRYPTQGQKALGGIKNPKLAKVVMKECDRQVAKFKADKDLDWGTLPEHQRQEKYNALLNTHAILVALGNLKNREALPFLKQYITPEYDGTLSYAASQAIGMIAPNDPAIFKELWGKSEEVRDINYGAYRKSALKEIAERMQDNNLSVAEKTELLGRSQIELRGASDAEEKKLLKDLTKNHPNAEMRETTGQSLMHTMRENFEPDDKIYLKQWLSNENEGSIGWALYVVRDHWDAQYVPELLKILKGSKWSGGRSDAAGILGRNKVKESLPYLESCILNDKEQTVRGSCRSNYYRITGKIFPDFTPEDMASLESYYKDPLTIKMFSRSRQDDPREQFEFARKRAFEEYKQNHK